MAHVSKDIISQVYNDLGCDTAFVPLPGRRGISYFNERVVDGEFYRFKIVEEHYKVEFVRVPVPLFNLTNSIWLHPDKQEKENHPIGYTLGIIWQENYIKESKLDALRFPNVSKLFDA